MTFPKLGQTGQQLPRHPRTDVAYCGATSSPFEAQSCRHSRDQGYRSVDWAAFTLPLVLVRQVCKGIRKVIRTGEHGRIAPYGRMKSSSPKQEQRQVLPSTFLINTIIAPSDKEGEREREKACRRCSNPREKTGRMTTHKLHPSSPLPPQPFAENSAQISRSQAIEDSNHDSSERRKNKQRKKEPTNNSQEGGGGGGNNARRHGGIIP